MRQIGPIFKNVGTAILLDEAIRQLNLEDYEYPESVKAAILCSAWRTRLWTFSEDALARQLVVKFRNRKFCSELKIPSGLVGSQAYRSAWRE